MMPTLPEGQAAELSNRDNAPLQAGILPAFQGNIEPVRVPFTYRLGILLVAVI